MANTYEVITFHGKISSKWPKEKVSIAEAILIILLIIGFECNTDNFRYEFTRLFLKQKYNSEKYLTLKVNKLGNSSWDAGWIIYWITNKALTLLVVITNASQKSLKKSESMYYKKNMNPHKTHFNIIIPKLLRCIINFI